MRVSVLAACALTLTQALACSGGERRQAATATVRDSAGTRIVESRVPMWKADAEWRIAEKPDVSIGTVDGAREYQFTNIRGVIELSDGRIVVADGGSLQLRCYAPDGTFLWASGRRGQGPGEYSTFTAIAAYRGDSVFVHDFAQRRFTVVAPNGAFGRTGSLALPPGVVFSGAVTAVGAWPDGSIAAMQQPVRSGKKPAAVTRRTHTLFRYTAAGDFGAAVDSVPGLEWFESTDGMGSMLPVPFGRNGRFVLTRDGAVTADNATYELRVVNAAGRLTQVVRRAVAAESIAPAIVAAERERLRTSRARVRDSIYRGMPAAMLGQMAANEEHAFQVAPFPPTYPAYGNVISDGDAYLWAERFVPPAHSAPDSAAVYSVFAPTGEWLGDVTAPRGLTISQVVSGHIVGVFTDDMGVQFVHRHSIIGWPKSAVR